MNCTLLIVLKKGGDVMKKFLATIAASAVMLASTALPSFASTANLSGTWQVIDHGTGAWAGGTLRADGAATGGGQFAFKTPDGVTQVAKIDAVSWSTVDATHLSLCTNITGVQGYVFPVGVTIFECIPLLITGTGAPVQPGFSFDLDAYEKVILH